MNHYLPLLFNNFFFFSGCFGKLRPVFIVHDSSVKTFIFFPFYKISSLAIYQIRNSFVNFPGNRINQKNSNRLIHLHVTLFVWIIKLFLKLSVGSCQVPGPSWSGFGNLILCKLGSLFLVTQYRLHALTACLGPEAFRFWRCSFNL